MASASTSSSRAPRRYLTDPLNAHERHQLRYARIADSYKRGLQPPRPQTKTELDVIKEKHQFIRDTDVDPKSLSWEDQLALKYYNSLFREFALVNLKHYKSGQIACRWRTEDELLQGIGQLTCASIRCDLHQPDPELVNKALSQEEYLDDSFIDPEQMDKPLVKARLSEHEMQFGYVEGGEKKSALVKVVLCKDCGRKLRYGKDVAKQQRDEAQKGQVQMAKATSPRREVERDRGSREGRRERSSVQDDSRDRSKDADRLRHSDSIRRRDRRRSASPPRSR
ncbi:hypothetical protein ACM66B_003015 [Microbotryomycetes sp. NB124-2]